MFGRLKKLFLIFLLSFLLFGCENTSNYKKVNLSSPLLKSSAPPEKSLRIAVSSMTSPTETLINYDPLIKYLEKKLNIPVYLYQRQNYSEVNDLLKAKMVDMAFICTYAYVKGKKDFGLEFLAAPQHNGSAKYYSYIIVHQDSKIDEFSELKGKTFAFTDPISNTGRLFPLYLLYQEKEDPAVFFHKIIFTYRHDRSLKAVADKIVDGAAVDSFVYDFALHKGFKYAQQVKIILKSPAFPSPPAVVSPQVNPEMKLKLKEILLNMHKDPEGKKVLQSLMLDKFVVIDDKEYDVIRKMAEKVELR